MRERFPTLSAPEVKTDRPDPVETVVHEMRKSQAVLKKMAKTRVEPKVQIRYQMVKPGMMGVAWVNGQNRLVKVLENRVTKWEKRNWIKVQLFTSLDPLGTWDREYSPLWAKGLHSSGKAIWSKYVVGGSLRRRFSVSLSV